MNKAVKICRNCPVMDRCRDYAITLARSEPIHGVWGGLRPSEINKLVRGRVR
jgi:WhiB family redox-sensing transcriptional regulator